MVAKLGKNLRYQLRPPMKLIGLRKRLRLWYLKNRFDLIFHGCNPCFTDVMSEVIYLGNTDYTLRWIKKLVSLLARQREHVLGDEDVDRMI